LTFSATPPPAKSFKIDSDTSDDDESIVIRDEEPAIAIEYSTDDEERGPKAPVKRAKRLTFSIERFCVSSNWCH